MGTKKGKKTPKPEVTLEQLIAVAEDFNSFMFADPTEGIDLELEYDELLAEVTETAEELEATDTIQKETAETLNALDIETVAGIADFDEPGEEEEENGQEEENVDDEDAAAKTADIALIKKTKDVEKLKNIAKAWSIRIPPPFYKDTAKLKEYLIGKLDGSAPAAEKKEKKEKTPKTPKEKKGKRDGIGEFVKNILMSSKEGFLTEDEKILQQVKANFPDGNTNVQNIIWYRYQIKNKGLIPTK
jgi:hypothetical protein